MRIDIYHHFPSMSPGDDKLNAILALVRSIANKQEALMTLADDINAKLDLAAASIAGVAGDVTALKDQIAALIAGGTGMSQADAETILAKVTTISDDLSALDLATP